MVLVLQIKIKTKAFQRAINTQLQYTAITIRTYTHYNTCTNHYNDSTIVFNELTSVDCLQLLFAFQVTSSQEIGYLKMTLAIPFLL